MSRLVDRLITQVRLQSENQDVSTNVGIQDIEILQYLNDAQDRLQSVITATHPTVFVKEKEIPTISNQEIYDIPSDSYKQNAITTVEFSATGDDRDLYHLEKQSLKNRYSTVSGAPNFYIRRSGKILLQPKPQSSGKIRLSYIKRIDRLDKRRGVIAVSATSGNSITALEFDPSSSSPALDSTTLLQDNYICVVDRDGNLLMRNIPIDNIDAATGVVTISSGFTFEDGETLPVGSYAVSGRDSTTHSELPRMCERYLIAYAVWKMLKRDSSVDYAEQQQELTSMEEDIVNSFADIDDDTEYIAILNDWSIWTES